MKKTHKSQHFVSQTYMKPWRDPTIAPNSRIEPYVWIFNKDGTGGKAKAPKNLFEANDCYAMTLPNGDRSLRLEHGLGDLEDKFTRIRNQKISKGVWPTTEEWVWLYAFTIAARARTMQFRDHQRRQWGRLRQDMERTLQRIEAVEGPPSHEPTKEHNSVTLEQVRKLEQYPMHLLIPASIQAHLPSFSRMATAILCTDDPTGFVTTDNPCTWFDPESHLLPAVWRSPALTAPGIEVTLPISPSKCLLHIAPP